MASYSACANLQLGRLLKPSTQVPSLIRHLHRNSTATFATSDEIDARISPSDKAHEEQPSRTEALTSASKQTAEEKNLAALDKVLSQFKELKESGALDIYEEDDGVEGEEGVDWVWWRASDASVDTTPNASTATNPEGASVKTSASKHKQAQNKKEVPDLSKVQPLVQPGGKISSKPMFQAKKRYDAPGSATAKSGSTQISEGQRSSKERSQSEKGKMMY